MADLGILAILLSARILIVDLLQYKNAMDGEGVYLSYVGPVYQGFVEETVEFLRNKVGNLIDNKGRTQKFFIVLIELVQNIMRYSVEETFDGKINQNVKSGVLVIGYREECFFVKAGNMINTADSLLLSTRLDKLLESDSKTLSSMYKTQLNSPQNESEVSSGLGLIEITRKASEKPEYSITKVDEKRAFFSIHVTV